MGGSAELDAKIKRVQDIAKNRGPVIIARQEQADHEKKIMAKLFGKNQSSSRAGKGERLDLGGARKSEGVRAGRAFSTKHVTPEDDWQCVHCLEYGHRHEACPNPPNAGSWKGRKQK